MERQLEIDEKDVVEEDTIDTIDQETCTILHFTDVYNLKERLCEPVGGFKRFCTQVLSHKDKDPILLFSGDALSPSLESMRTHGEHMVTALNNLGVHCAVLGNHEFDFGVENLARLVEMSNFPWLLSNITDGSTGLPLAGAKPHHVLEVGCVRIGVVGLVQDWLYQQQATRHVEYVYKDYVEVGRHLAQDLRKGGCNVVVALTHMKWEDDKRLAESVAEIDLVLGGHDHQYGVQVVRGKTIVKSGTEFRHLSVITLGLEDGKVSSEVEREDITAQVEKKRDVELGLDDGKLGYVWMVPLYLWWAVKYHGYKRYAKVRRALRGQN